MLLKVGFGHRSGVGKDTGAKLLITHLNVKVPKLRVRQVNFADKLKDVCWQMYSWAGLKRKVHYENHREDRNIKLPQVGLTPVEIWVLVGEKFREIYERTWIDYVNNHPHQADLIVTADVRHENEIGIFDKAYKIVNPNVPVREGISIDDKLADYTDWDGEFLNDGNIKKLNLLMGALADHLIKEYNL